jgi:hypothetical protein
MTGGRGRQGWLVTCQLGGYMQRIEDVCLAKVKIVTRNKGGIDRRITPDKLILIGGISD